MLTILIPSYNHESYIIECLQKAVKVKVNGLKVLVIDDGSTDQTARLVQEYIDKNSYNIQLIEKENSGLTSSLNMGLKLIDTEFLYLVASDDIPSPSGIEHCIQKLQEDENLKFIIGGAKYFDGKNILDSVYTDKHYDFFKLPPKVREKEMFLNYPQPILLQSSIFRVNALHEVKGWSQEVMSDDYHMFVRLLTKYPEYNSDFHFRPDINVSLYRIHSSNAHKNLNKQFYMILQVIDLECGDRLKGRAIGKLSAQYLLICLKKVSLYNFMNIIRLTPTRSVMWLTWYIPKILLSYLMSSKLDRS